MQLSLPLITLTLTLYLLTTPVPSALAATHDIASAFLASRQAISGDSHGGQGYTVLPLLSDEPPATAILVHGLGGTGKEWGYVSLALSFFSLNFVKFVIPTAPTVPVTYLNETLPSWYDIFTISDFGSQVNNTELLVSVARINGIIAGEKAAGVDYSRIFIIGFSQGGGVAITTFLRSKFPLAGCVGVATWLPRLDLYPRKLSNVTKHKQVLFIHGTEDEAVPISYAVLSRNRINEFGKSIKLTSEIIRLVGEKHLIVNDVVMTHIEEYITQRANGTTRYLVQIVKDLTDAFSKVSSGIDVRSIIPTNRDNCNTTLKPV